MNKHMNIICISKEKVTNVLYFVGPWMGGIGGNNNDVSSHDLMIETVD